MGMEMSPELKDLIDGLMCRIAALEAEVIDLRAENAELKRRLGMNSGNSSQPPSADGLKKPRVPVSLRTKSGKKSGGQEGHKGAALRQTEHPDKIVDHYPKICAGCGEALQGVASLGHAARQVFDLPEPRPLEVTEHRAHSCVCPCCSATTTGTFPEDVTAPAQYGNALASLIVYLQIQHHIPEERVVEIMHDVFGIDLATDTAANMRKAKAQKFRGLAEAIGEIVKKVPVKHMDETGFRVAGALVWLHVAATSLLTFYRLGPQRGAMLAGTVGIIVHDFWGSYFKMPDVAHALCNAHLMRELKALMENEKEAWAFAMFRFLQQVCHAINIAKRLGRPLDADFIAFLEARYDRIVAQGLTYHQSLSPLDDPNKKRRRGRKRHRIGENLLIRLHDYRTDILRYLRDPAVPFTNNQAEQDVRMMKIRQKVSGSFRTTEGAENFSILRSVISTARKQGWNILQTLAAQNPIALIQNLKTA
jgi:transposase